MTAMLPPEFADLEAYAATWCLPTEAQRWAQRANSSMPELVAFYDAVFPRAEEAIEYCDKFPLDDLPDEVRHLLQLVHSLIMAAMSVEVFGQVKTVDSADAVLNRVSEPLP
jgi:hypothetical protein